MQFSSVSFTGVVPVRVYIDGREAIDSQNVQKGCRKLIELLAGPLKNNNHAQKIGRRFAQTDKDYNYARAMTGYQCRVYENGRPVKKTASNYFRFINKQGRNFLITGPQAEILAQTGKALGLAKAAANMTASKDSFELFTEKNNYSDWINKIISNRVLRMREGYDSATRKNTGNETVLDIFLKSNQKYGKKTFKMEVETIDFKPYGKN